MERAASLAARAALALVEAVRPPSLRAYDQIPMHGPDLLRQVRRAAPRLAGQRVVFMGDHDGASLLLALLARVGLVDAPAWMLVLDFDARLIEAVVGAAQSEGLTSLLDARVYNAFHALPPELAGRFDAFYTNPPYGASNGGASARLFITRGGELTGGTSAQGHLLLPDDPARPWSRESARTTRRFLGEHGWTRVQRTARAHGYHLDDDPQLRSCYWVVERSAEAAPPLPWAGRAVDQAEIPCFYGRSVAPPYPVFIPSGPAVLASRAAS